MTTATLNDLKEFLLINLLIEFDRIGRNLINFGSWDKYSHMWFDALQCGIDKVDKIR